MREVVELGQERELRTPTSRQHVWRVAMCWEHGRWKAAKQENASKRSGKEWRTGNMITLLWHSHVLHELVKYNTLIIRFLVGKKRKDSFRLEYGMVQNWQDCRNSGEAERRWRNHKWNCGESFAAPRAHIRCESSASEDLGMHAHSAVKAGIFRVWWTQDWKRNWVFALVKGPWSAGSNLWWPH